MSDLLQGRSAQLDRVLSDLLRQAPEVEAASVVSFDGLPMASALPAAMDENRVAAMSAALLSLGERAAEGLGRGELSQVYVEGESGTVFLISAEDEAVLVAVGARGAKVGLLLYEIRRAAHAVGAALRQDEPEAAARRGLPPQDAWTVPRPRAWTVEELVAATDEPTVRARGGRAATRVGLDDPLGTLTTDADDDLRAERRRSRRRGRGQDELRRRAAPTRAPRSPPRTWVPGPRSRPARRARAQLATSSSSWS